MAKSTHRQPTAESCLNLPDVLAAKGAAARLLDMSQNVPYEEETSVFVEAQHYMTSFFWVAQTANAVTLTVSLAALLIVIWLGPRRWTNLSFAALLVAVIIWMGFSLVARLLVNVPQLGGDPTAL